MIRSNAYVPDVRWLQPPPGRGMSVSTADAFFRLIAQPQEASLPDICAVFYAQPGHTFPIRSHIRDDPYGDDLGDLVAWALDEREDGAFRPLQAFRHDF